MTRDEAKEAAMVMLAYANGEQVQVQLSDGSWKDFPISPHFDWNHVNYRIKPKPESKYRPFETKEECWNEMLKHQPFGWLRDEDGDYILPATVGNKSDFIFRFKVYKFTDGTPFGIKEE